MIQPIRRNLDDSKKGENVFALSEEAQAYLAEKLDQLDVQDGTVFRIEVNGKTTLKLGPKSESDVCFTHQGKTILALTSFTAKALKDKRLVLGEMEKRPKLKLE